MHEAFVINWGYVILLFILGGISYKRKSLDLLGSLIMVFMGITIIFSAGVPWFILITAKNVISNGLVAFLMAAFGSYYLPLAGGFIGAVATATADTLASEIGVLQEPRLITTFKKVPAGTDGAISILGTSAAIVGAGRHYINNEHVNLLATICGAIIGIVSVM